MPLGTLMRLLSATIFALFFGTASAQNSRIDRLFNLVPSTDILLSNRKEKPDSINTEFQQKTDNFQQEPIRPPIILDKKGSTGNE